jgi:hypothetical protein
MIVEDDVDDRLYFSDAVKEINASNECIEATERCTGIETIAQSKKLPDFIFY